MRAVRTALWLQAAGALIAPTAAATYRKVPIWDASRALPAPRAYPLSSRGVQSVWRAERSRPSSQAPESMDVPPACEYRIELGAPVFLRRLCGSTAKTLLW